MVSTKLVQLTAQVEKHEQDGSASKSELSVLKKSLDALSSSLTAVKGSPNSEDVERVVSVRLAQLTAQVEKHEQEGSASQSELSVLKKSLDALSLSVSSIKGKDKSCVAFFTF